MPPVLERPEPPYLQIAHQIRQQILSGVLRDGDQIPPARKIAQEWGVAIATATKVLATLRSEGLTRAVPGKGTVVASAATVDYGAPDRLVAIRRTGRIYPPNERAEIRTVDLVAAPDQVADALSIDHGAPVIRRYRVTLRDEVPASASTSWFDGALAASAPQLLVADRIRQGTSRYIEEMTGRAAVRLVERVSARAASEQAATDLQVTIGSPVLSKRSWWYDPEGAVLEYGESISLPDREASYEYEIRPAP
ncbi:GntR family transcriptional regulator [Planomonospora parontospora subsp. parontospora]|uniref:GntR family transcriptional regulator n=2 Tax=Planomonospora parontospora TaxID=58119 RepID=A0AA37F7L3_9ACTN|nr:GntR family transcriptional regulator [Planomonospora parontospora]GGK94216.1 GntR family transcriptional regulator [Planomonospora parontospora]GII12655.1 GntR family transcriptional regulator [Planomonospora parontospora subsp. parontospora]